MRAACLPRRVRHGVGRSFRRSAVYLVVGLGNPGAQYQGHRHNVGFMTVDRIAQAHAREPFREKFSGLFAKASLDGTEFALLKPQTFMNLSGTAVQKALHFFKLELGELIVVHDELDLSFATVKVKVGGGTAGHNGLKSIVQSCGSPDFVRVRVGIGRPRSGSGERHVLSDFSKDECLELSNVVESASLAVGDVVLRGAQAAMNRHNQAAKPEPARPS
jgi:PTH1 family peptidyl-tRNA hydrolase